MAKQKKTKEPGRIRQLLRVYKITAKRDPTSVWLTLLAFLLSVGAGVGIGLLISNGSAFTMGLWVFTGVASGILIGLIVMSKRAERAAYVSIEGQAGAVGAVIDSSRRKSWRGSAMPIAVNPKTREAVYRVIGRAGVVLVGEGSSPRVKQMLDDEARKITRAVPGVTVHKLSVGDELRLHNLMSRVYKLKKSLSRREVTVVANRLEALGTALPIPKGIDPNRFRPSRK